MALVCNPNSTRPRLTNQVSTNKKKDRTMKFLMSLTRESPLLLQSNSNVDLIPLSWPISSIWRATNSKMKSKKSSMTPTCKKTSTRWVTRKIRTYLHSLCRNKYLKRTRNFYRSNITKINEKLLHVPSKSRLLFNAVSAPLRSLKRW